jgi:hypothetical protein
MRASSEHAVSLIRAHDGEMRVILAELAENAGRLASNWAGVLSTVSDDYTYARRTLYDMEVALAHIVLQEQKDALKIVRSSIRVIEKLDPD